MNKLLLTQIPNGTPNPGESKALDLSNPFEIIIFIVMPILIFIIYLLWRHNKKK